MTMPVDDPSTTKSTGTQDEGITTPHELSTSHSILVNISSPADKIYSSQGVSTSSLTELLSENSSSAVLNRPVPTEPVNLGKYKELLVTNVKFGYCPVPNATAPTVAQTPAPANTPPQQNVPVQSTSSSANVTSTTTEHAKPTEISKYTE